MSTEHKKIKLKSKEDIPLLAKYLKALAEGDTYYKPALLDIISKENL
jgi:hypothetical protein